MGPLLSNQHNVGVIILLSAKLETDEMLVCLGDNLNSIWYSANERNGMKAEI